MTKARCPVVVFHAPNVPEDALVGVKCWNCGEDLYDHPWTLSLDAPSGMAYAMKPPHGTGVAYPAEDA